FSSKKIYQYPVVYFQLQLLRGIFGYYNFATVRTVVEVHPPSGSKELLHGTKIVFVAHPFKKHAFNRLRSFKNRILGGERLHLFYALNFIQFINDRIIFLDW